MVQIICNTLQVPAASAAVLCNFVEWFCNPWQWCHMAMDMGILCDSLWQHSMGIGRFECIYCFNSSTFAVLLESIYLGYSCTRPAYLALHAHRCSADCSSWSGTSSAYKQIILADRKSVV